MPDGRRLGCPWGKARWDGSRSSRQYSPAQIGARRIVEVTYSGHRCADRDSGVDGGVGFASVGGQAGTGINGGRP